MMCADNQAAFTAPKTGPLAQAMIHNNPLEP